MGNLIRDFWTYQYKGKSYYGIGEVIAGSDLKQQRHIKRFETHIEKALEYTLKHDLVSHMSIQKYLKKSVDVSRKDNEETFYPFFFEFEPKCSCDKAPKEVFMREYKAAVGEAIKVVRYSIDILDVDEKDILILINNSRSIYVMYNPRTYGLRPSNKLHLIYKEMYKAIDEEIGLNYVDASLYNSYGLMKTPNCYYKGGYFTKISFEQLQKLHNNPGIKSMLTSTKKSLDYYIPAIHATGLTELYNNAKEKVLNLNTKLKDKQVTYITNCSAKCVEHIENYTIGPGSRNHALVSVGIFYKNKGFTAEQVEQKLLQLSSTWGHDESSSDIASKVRSIFRYDYQFSCKFAASVLNLEDMEGLCSRCPYNAQNKTRLDRIPVQANIIKELWSNKASVRHYIAYLKLSQDRLFNTWFDPKEKGVNDRTLRELCNLSNNLIREKRKELIYITNKATGNVYNLPTKFMELEAPAMLGEYLKHYLMILIKGYNTKKSDKYIKLNVSKEKIKNDLGYGDISSVYKLLSRLKKLGFLVVKGGKLVALYYTTYKVHNLEEFREERLRKNGNDLHLSVEVVNGEQITFRTFGLDKRGSPG